MGKMLKTIVKEIMNEYNHDFNDADAYDNWDQFHDKWDCFDEIFIYNDQVYVIFTFNSANIKNKEYPFSKMKRSVWNQEMYDVALRIFNKIKKERSSFKDMIIKEIYYDM